MENADLGWWEGVTFRTEPGIVWNISQGGAALDVAADLPIGEAVWLRITDLPSARWLPGRLLGREGRVVRLQFAEPIPSEMVEAIVWGAPGLAHATSGLALAAPAPR